MGLWAFGLSLLSVLDGAGGRFLFALWVLSAFIGFGCCGPFLDAWPTGYMVVARRLKPAARRRNDAETPKTLQLPKPPNLRPQTLNPKPKFLNSEVLPEGEAGNGREMLGFWACRRFGLEGVVGHF